MKKILITGGAGYIGSHVVKLLGEQGYDITVIDNFSTGNRGAILYGNLIEGDIGNESFLESIFSSHNFEAVLNFAGSIKVPESVENPIKYYNNNTSNTFLLIQKCIKYKVNKFVFSSTAATYGDNGEGIFRETTLQSPINPYGRSKLMTEWMLQDIAHAHPDFKFVGLRYFNVAGADLDGKIGQAFPEPFHLINIAAEAASGKREKMYVFGTDYDTSDGTCVRDYIHVSDLASAHFSALKYLEDGGKSDFFNCGYGKGFSVNEVIDMVKKVTGVDFKVETAPRREGDPATLISEVTKIHKHLDWKPQFDDLNTIISSAYNWEKGDTLRSWRS